MLCSPAKQSGGLRDRVECCVPQLNTPLSERQDGVLCSPAKHPGGLRETGECCVLQLNTLGVLRDRVECCVVPQLNILGI